MVNIQVEKKPQNYISTMRKKSIKYKSRHSFSHCITVLPYCINIKELRTPVWRYELTTHSRPSTRTWTGRPFMIRMTVAHWVTRRRSTQLPASVAVCSCGRCSPFFFSPLPVAGSSWLTSHWTALKHCRPIIIFKMKSCTSPPCKCS